MNFARPLRALRLLALGLALFLCVALRAGAEEPRVRAGQTIADLLNKKGSDGADPAGTPSAERDGAAKLGAWAAALVALGGVFFFVRRAKLLPRAAFRPAEGLELAGRIALTPRHSVHLVCGRGRCVWVGVAGDRMVSLGEFSEAARPAAEPQATVERCEPAESAAAPSETAPSLGGFTIRPQDREAIATARALHDEDLQPYRRQMDRMRDILRGIRPGLDPGTARGDGGGA